VRNNWIRWAAFAAICVGFVETTQAAPFYVSSDRFGYTGTISRYASVADAQNGVNPTATYAAPQRDLALLAIQDAPGLGFVPANPPSEFSFLTAFFLPGPDGTIESNPNNDPVGFIQIRDVNGSTITSAEGQFLDPNRTTFQLSLTGANALPGSPGDDARLFNANPSHASDKLSPTLSEGTFLSYALNATFTGLTPAINNGTFFDSTNQTPALSVAGTFTGIFQNTNPVDPTFNGIYRADLTLNNINFAVANGILTPADGGFGAAVVVPEPTSLALLGFGGLCLLARSRLRGRPAPVSSQA